MEQANEINSLEISADITEGYMENGPEKCVSDDKSAEFQRFAPHEAARCAGKQQFAGRGEAVAVLRGMKKRSKRRNSKSMYRGSCEPYRCGCCGFWHLGRARQ